jgi:tryptophan aminotransferase
MERHLRGLAEWDVPEAGMFVWSVPPLPLPRRAGTDWRRFKLLVEGDDAEALVRTHALERGVLALPGTVFLPDGRKTAYVRASFSLLDEAEVEEACRRLADTVREARA